MKLTSSASYDSLPCITRARYGTTIASLDALVRMTMFPDRVPSIFPLYMSETAGTSTFAGRIPSPAIRARTDGSGGRIVTSRISTGSPPALSRRERATQTIRALRRHSEINLIRRPKHARMRPRQLHRDANVHRPILAALRRASSIASEWFILMRMLAS